MKREFRFLFYVALYAAVLFVSCSQGPEEVGPCTLLGVTYNGLLTESGPELNRNIKFSNFDGRIDFDYPHNTVVTADGFVRIKGRLTPSTKDFSECDKVIIYVSVGKEKTTYICDKNFDVRVWLPFSGEHEIVIGPAYTKNYYYKDDKNKTCEGDYKEYSWVNLYTIKATNTHVHDIADSGSTDGRYVYPSFDCQSDSSIIQSITRDVLKKLPNNASDKDKFKLIHDYIVRNYHYDYDSIGEYSNFRKKQDALSVVKNKTGVCAGYTALTAAMCRCAGIPAKYVISETLNHAWNHVLLDGKWYFVDVTWDDPVKNPDSNYISYDYYLLEDFNGVRNDHYANDVYVDSGRYAFPYVVPQVFDEPELPLLLMEGNEF